MVTLLHSREEFVQLVVLSHAEGVGIRALARRFGCGRNTIRKILRKHQARRDEGPDGLAPQRKGVPRKTKLDPFAPQIAKTIEQFPDITGQRLFEILKESGYDGGISILRERLKRLRPKPKREPIVRFETEPGQQGQMDWNHMSPAADSSSNAPARARSCASPTSSDTPAGNTSTSHCAAISSP